MNRKVRLLSGGFPFESLSPPHPAAVAMRIAIAATAGVQRVPTGALMSRLPSESEVSHSGELALTARRSMSGLQVERHELGRSRACDPSRPLREPIGPVAGASWHGPRQWLGSPGHRSRGVTRDVVRPDVVGAANVAARPVRALRRSRHAQRTQCREDHGECTQSSHGGTSLSKSAETRKRRGPSRSGVVPTWSNRFGCRAPTKSSQIG